MTLYLVTAVCFGAVAITFVIVGPRAGVVVMAAVLAALVPGFGHEAGAPTEAGERLAQEQWRVLSIAPLADDRFLVSVLYQAGDVRTYRLTLSSPEARDRFLKAGQDLKHGKVMNGKAKHGRAGLMNDDSMGIEFGEAPEAEPKPSS